MEAPYELKCVGPERYRVKDKQGNDLGLVFQEGLEWTIDEPHMSGFKSREAAAGYLYGLKHRS